MEETCRDSYKNETKQNPLRGKTEFRVGVKEWRVQIQCTSGGANAGKRGVFLGEEVGRWGMDDSPVKC